MSEPVIPERYAKDYSFLKNSTANDDPYIVALLAELGAAEAKVKQMAATIERLERQVSGLVNHNNTLLAAVAGMMSTFGDGSCAATDSARAALNNQVKPCR